MHGIDISFFSGAGKVTFSLRNTMYQNNSRVTLEDIGVDDDALLCVTELTACCRSPYTDETVGNWYFPNGTRFPVRLALQAYSGISTEPEITVWYLCTEGEVERMESTAVRYLMLWVLSRQYTLKQPLVSNLCIQSTYNIAYVAEE